MSGAASRWRSPVTALFAIAVVALLAAATLTVAVAAGAEGPEACCAGPVADRRAWPSPTTPTAQPTRENGLPACLVGSWRSTTETLMVEFYTDWDPAPFHTGGRHYEFRPDGVVIETNDNVSMSGRNHGRSLLLVVNGTRTWGWTADPTRITYGAMTASTSVWQFYDDGRYIDSVKQPPDKDHHSVLDYECAGNQLTIRDDDGFRSALVRTADAGVYG